MKKTFLSILLALSLLSFSSLCMAGSQTASDLEPWSQPLPKLDDLESAALSYAGMSTNKISRWERNARRAVALPRLQVGYDQKAQQQNTGIIQDNVSVTSSGVTIGPEANRVDQNFGNNRGFEVKAVWSLDELLFNRDELEVSREARDLLVFRSRLQEELRQTYYDIKAEFLRFQLEPEARDDPFEILKTQQSMDKLNSLSGGEFYRLFPFPQLPNPQHPTSLHAEKNHAENAPPPNPRTVLPESSLR